MMDRINSELRSKLMSRIRSTNTQPEITLRQALWNEGLKGYRLHYNLPGKPDIVYPLRKIAIFVDGDFWHGYLWKAKHKIPPKKYWQHKIQGNINRDKRITRQLRKECWTVMRFWEHEIRKNLDKVVKKIVSKLKK